jgi:hypothetical protein
MISEGLLSPISISPFSTRSQKRTQGLFEPRNCDRSHLDQASTHISAPPRLPSAERNGWGAFVAEPRQYGRRGAVLTGRVVASNRPVRHTRWRGRSCLGMRALRAEGSPPASKLRVAVGVSRQGPARLR